MPWRSPAIRDRRFRKASPLLREEPLLLVAELTWRWCFAVAAWLLVLLAAALFLDSLKVTALDRYLLGTMQPVLERSALNHVFHGALLRYVWIKFFALAGLTVLWAFAAAVGRAASLRNLVALAGGDDRDEDAGWQFRPMFQLHLLRALWTWTALACFIASALLGNRDVAAAPCCARRLLLRLWRGALDRFRRDAELDASASRRCSASAIRSTPAMRYRSPSTSAPARADASSACL